MASESKKEAFRKYLEASGVLDALTKVLVALYEEHDKPLVAIEFVRKSLGGPTVAEYDQVKVEKQDLQAKYDELCAQHEEACKQLALFQPVIEEVPPELNTDPNAPPAAALAPSAAPSPPAS